MAVDYGDVRAAVSAEGAITANLQLVSRLLGMIVQRHDVRILLAANVVLAR